MAPVDNRRRRTVLKTLGAAGVATVTGLAGCTGDGGDGGGDGTDGGDGGSTSTPGSELEDSITVYANTAIQPIADAFQEETGVTVDLSVLSGPRAQAKFLSEAEAGTYQMDVLLNAATQTAWNHDHWAEVEIENQDAVLNDRTREKLDEIGALGKVWPWYGILPGFVSNPNAVSEPPSAWEGLPDHDARMVTPGFNTDNIYRVLLREMDKDAAQEYYPRLHENFAKFPSNHTVATEEVIGGQADIGVHIFLGSSLPDEAPIDVSFPPWTSNHVEAAAMSAEAPNPNASKAFIRWLTSEAGQMALQDSGAGLPIYQDVGHGNEKIRSALEEYDPNIYQDIYTQDEHSQTTSEAEELVGGGGS